MPYALNAGSGTSPWQESGNQVSYNGNAKVTGNFSLSPTNDNTMSLMMIQSNINKVGHVWALQPAQDSGLTADLCIKKFDSASQKWTTPLVIGANGCVGIGAIFPSGGKLHVETIDTLTPGYFKSNGAPNALYAVAMGADSMGVSARGGGYGLFAQSDTGYGIYSSAPKNYFSGVVNSDDTINIKKDVQAGNNINAGGNITAGGNFTVGGRIGIGELPQYSKLDIKGTTHRSHFYYGTNEDTYIRPGIDTGSVIVDQGKGIKIGPNNSYVPHKPYTPVIKTWYYEDAFAASGDFLIPAATSGMANKKIISASLMVQRQAGCWSYEGRLGEQIRTSEVMFGISHVPFLVFYDDGRININPSSSGGMPFRLFVVYTD